MFKYGDSEATVYFCLSLESYVECKERQLSVVCAFDVGGLEETLFVQEGMSLAKEFMNKVANVVGLSSNEITIFSSQFVRPLTMMLFDQALAKGAIESYKPLMVFFPNQEYRDIVSGDYSLHNGLFNLMLAIEQVCRDKGITFVRTGQSPVPNNRVWSVRESVMRVVNGLSPFKRVLVSAREMLTGRSDGRTLSGKPRLLLRGLRGHSRIVDDLKTRLSDNGFSVITDHCGNQNRNRVRDRLSAERQIKRSGLKKILKELVRLQEDHAQLKNFLATSFDHSDNENCFVRFEVHSMIKYMIKIVRAALQQARELATLRPNLVIHELSAFSLVMACKRLRILTIALPHGGVMSAEFTPMVADVNVMPGSIQQTYHEEVGMVSGRQVICGVPHIEIQIPKESIAVNGLNGSQEKQRTVVMLAKNMGRRRWEYDDYQSYIEMLESMASYTALLGYNFIVRLHPSGGREALDLYKRMECKFGGMMCLSIDEPFSVVAERGDLFVATQEATVIAELLAMEKPVLFPIYHLSESYCQNPLIKELSRRLLSPQTSDELIEQLRRLFEEEAYKDEVLLRQRELTYKLVRKWGSATNCAIADLAAQIVKL